MARLAAHPSSQHAITVVVAAGIAGAGLAGGGNSELAFSAFSVAVWTAVLIGVAAGVFPRSEPPRAAIAAGACLGVLVAIVAVSMAYASDPGSAFKELVRASGYLGLFVLVVVASRRGEVKPWLRGLAGGLMLITLLALGARLLPAVFGDGDLQVAVLAEAEGRLSWPIGYWNGLAAVMAIVSALLAWLAVRSEGRVGRSLATGLIAAPLLGIYFTASRGGFAAVAIGLVVLLAVVRPRLPLIASAALGIGGGAVLIALASTRDDLTNTPGTPAADSQGAEMLVALAAVVVVVTLLRYALDARIPRLRVSRRAKVATAVLVAVGGLAVLVAADPVQRWEDFKAPPAPTASSSPVGPELARSSSSGRYQYWDAALNAFAEQPLTGIGAGDYEPYWYQHTDIQLVTRSAHSLFLENLAELGIVGGLATIAFFATAGFVAWRRLGTLGTPPRDEIAVALTVVAVGVAVAAVEWIWNLPAVFAPVVIAAALLVGPATLPALAPRVAPPMAFVRSRRRFFVGVGVLLVAWAAICASGVVLLAERSLEHGRAANARQDYTDAIAEAREAIDLAPWSSEPYAFLAQSYQLAGDLPRAQHAVKEAIERAPEDWRLWMLATQLDIGANDVAGARLNFERAYDLIPAYKVKRKAYFEALVASNPY
jgi:hypothetical protein